MSRHTLVTIAIATMIAITVSAQSRSTADGVAALAAGDYQRAVEILKPVAENWRTDDTAAQFFMAGLYESGRGVPADPLRACALYARAASQYDSPFGRQANPLFAALIGRGQEFNDECQLLANIGFDTGFQPATFDLGAGHYVEWTLSAITITYDGRTKRHSMPLAMRGGRFLPLQHVELTTGPTRSVTRHFIEAFLWYPTEKSGPWNLQWHLFEVVGDEIVRIDTPDAIVTVDGDAPPGPEAFNVRDYAVVRVDDDGNSEWAVLKGPRAAAERIETDTERREARDAQNARDAALKRVDWSRRSDAHRQPTMTYVDSEGCGFAEVVGWTANRDEALVVRANIPDLASSPRVLTFDLSREVGTIFVDAHVYDTAQRNSEFCTDVRSRSEDAMEPEVWHAVAGTASIELSGPGVGARTRATVTLTNVVLRNAAGTMVTMSRPVTLSAIVGTVFG